ncbi:MAG: flagellar motor switch protein FliM [Desulfobacterales bacterium]|nr:flagellar motor switch protein FliM [Desulfobacterales bacterium]
MSENVLSQEEIDALLTAMDRGEVDLETEEKKAEPKRDAKSYDLTSQSAMLRNQFYALEEVYDKFASLLTRGLSSSLQKTIEVELVSSEMVKYGEFIQAFSNPTSFSIFGMDPLIGSSLMAVEPNLVFSLIDCMFGGEGKPIGEIREFTLIEQRMMRKFSMEVLKNLEKAWEIVYAVNIGVKKTETKPEYVHLVPPDELMIIVVLALEAEEFSGNIHLCVSYRMLEPIKDKLSSRYLREKEMEHVFSAQLEGLILDTWVNLTSELGRTRSSVRELLSLSVDDVIRLNNGPEDPIRINVEKVPKFLGHPGIVKGNRAVRISSMIK